jgi:hypothetical protein
VDAAALAGLLGAGHIHDLFLRMVHHAHPLLDALRDHGARNQCAIGVEGFDPIVVDDSGTPRIDLAYPDNRPASRKREHQQVVGIGRVDTPFLVRGNEVEYYRPVAVRLSVKHRLHRLGIDRRTIDAEALAESTHPQMILVKLLTAGEGAPRDKFVNVGIARAVADFLRFQAGPDRRRDDLARLRDHIAEADLLVCLGSGEMSMFPPGKSTERSPGLYRDLAVRLGREAQNDFTGIDIRIDARKPFRRSLVGHDAIQVLE